MTSGKRCRLSATERGEVWRRWKDGQSLHAIGRALGRAHPVVHLLLKRHGGIAPPARRRSRRVLTLAEREDISRGIASGCSLRVIAQRLRRAPCTVSREVARHGGRRLYRANEADQRAWDSALRPKRCLLATHHKLQRIVAGKLMLDGSPKQISGWLQQQDDESLRVSHETIYRSLFIQARGALKIELIQHKSFTIATNVQVYFCDPQSPWQRGSNENTNGLLRQHLPKKSDLSRFTQSELNAIAQRLNTRPRQTLGFQTPADKLQASVASTP